MLYGVIYGFACLTKHFSSFWVLLVGRIASGVATSLLFSAFESWLVHQHHAVASTLDQCWREEEEREQEQAECTVFPLAVFPRFSFIAFPHVLPHIITLHASSMSPHS